MYRARLYVQLHTILQEEADKPSQDAVRIFGRHMWTCCRCCPGSVKLQTSQLTCIPLMKSAVDHIVNEVTVAPLSEHPCISARAPCCIARWEQLFT